MDKKLSRSRVSSLVGVLSGVSTSFTKTYTLGGVMVATKTDGVVHYVSSDHLGSTSVSHNTDTGSTGKVTYFPFGADRSRTGFVGSPRFRVGFGVRGSSRVGLRRAGSGCGGGRSW
jgi:hypothetical protein